MSPMLRNAKMQSIHTLCSALSRVVEVKSFFELEVLTAGTKKALNPLFVAL